MFRGIVRLCGANGACSESVQHARSLSTGGMLRLNNISDNPGSRKKPKRVGRGEGGGKGKTAGRGQKGDGSRSGNEFGAEFEGGQTPIHMRFPKRGFNNQNSRSMEPLNLSKVKDWLESGRLRPNENGEITITELYKSNIVGNIEHGVKLLGDGAGSFDIKANFVVSQASKSAIQSIEAAGGTVKTVYHNRLGLRAAMKPEKFDILPKPALPPPRLIDYYTSKENRGYLSDEGIQQFKISKVLKE